MKHHHTVRGGTRKNTFLTKKKAAALALCVSLWMAGGSVAGAADYYTHDGETISGTGHQNDSIKVADNYTVTITGTVKSVTGANTGIVITINGGNIGGNTKQDVAGGFATSGSTAITNNKVTVTSGSSAAYVCGGQTRNSATGDIEKNKVYISGDETSVRGVYGGYVYISQTGIAGSVKENEVHISGGKVRGGSVYGGYTNGTGNEASGNLVEISGGTVESDNLGYGGDIYGGRSVNGAANNNVVNILKDGIALKNVHGGHGTSSSGNTINIAAKGVTVTSIQNMQKLSFYLPSTIAANDTMLTITGGNASNLTGVTIGAAALTGVSLAKGDTVDLIYNANGLTTDGTLKTTELTTPPKATSLTVDKSYKFAITKKDANTITATVSDVQEEQNEERTEQAKSLVETKAATTTFVNAGADMLASQGFQQAANAVALEAAEGAKTGAGVPNVGSFTPFAAFGGSGMRAESGSYVDTRGYGLNIGFARELPNAQGKLLFGPVVEYGGGSYTSHLDDGTRGDGKAHYFGVGVMARQVNHDGFYYEGSLRGGRVTSDYDGNLEGVGRVDYDSASNYFAAHLGAGKAFDIGSGNTLDGYFKYFYSHQAGDTATIHIAGLNDETGEFDAVDSHRIRLGARLTHTINEKNKLYGGLAYQYEFGGDARATFNGTSAPSPSVKGSSGMLELGWQVKPGDGPLTLDLGVTGWAGKQRGGSIQLGATWSF